MFTDRRGGVSPAPYASGNLGEHVGDEPAAVAENRARLAYRLGLAPDRVVWMKQVHGAQVATVVGPSPPVPGADALVTGTPGLALCVLVADCVPVLLADATAGVIAAAHAGRRGVTASIVAAVSTRMRARGAHPRHTTAWVGPAICGRCYEVPAAMRADVARVAPAAAAATRAGRPALDLPAAVVEQLIAAGVVDIRRDGRCTAEDPDLFSYRRDGRTGRTAGVVLLT
ncbi:MAG: peptidoglycan editing factor PgeF [Frankiaceae bacterium]